MLGIFLLALGLLLLWMAVTGRVRQFWEALNNRPPLTETPPEKA